MPVDRSRNLIHELGRGSSAPRSLERDYSQVDDRVRSISLRLIERGYRACATVEMRDSYLEPSMSLLCSALCFVSSVRNACGKDTPPEHLELCCQRLVLCEKLGIVLSRLQQHETVARWVREGVGTQSRKEVMQLGP